MKQAFENKEQDLLELHQKDYLSTEALLSLQNIFRIFKSVQERQALSARNLSPGRGLGMEGNDAAVRSKWEGEEERTGISVLKSWE